MDGELNPGLPFDEGPSILAISSNDTFACTTAHPRESPMTFITVLNLSRNQSTARIREILSEGKPIAVITITRVTNPACGIPAAPILATVAVILNNNQSLQSHPRI